MRRWPITIIYVNGSYNIRKRELLAEQLKRESLLCRDESLRVLKEFEAIDENGN